MARRFRKLRGLDMSYRRQGFIWFTCANYRDMSPRMREKIRTLAQRVAGENAPALMELLTTERGVEEICQRYSIASPSRLYEARKEFFRAW